MVSAATGIQVRQRASSECWMLEFYEGGDDLKPKSSLYPFHEMPASHVPSDLRCSVSRRGGFQRLISSITSTQVVFVDFSLCHFNGQLIQVQCNQCNILQYVQDLWRWLWRGLWNVTHFECFVLIKFEGKDADHTNIFESHSLPTSIILFENYFTFHSCSQTGS